MAKKDYTDIKVNKLPQQEVEIEGEITVEKMDSMRKKAIESLKKEITLPGFRKGTAPENMIVQHVGEIKILEEAGEIALGEVYPQILEDEKLDPIGKPSVQITKIGAGSPLGFKIKTSLMPEVKLGDYKKIAKRVFSTEDSVEVSEKEIDDVIQNIRKNVAHAKMHEKEGVSEHDHSHGEIKDEDLPEVDDDFLKQIGSFESVEALKVQIKENLLKEKNFKAKDKKRTMVLEEIISSSTIEIPQIIVDGELEKMKAQFTDDLAQSGVKFEDYLTHIKKTEDDLKTEWTETATKRAKSQIILNTISREEGIRPEEENVKAEMEKILSYHKDAERFRVRMYVETFLANDMVFGFLEGLKK
ncbi:MAG: trigger factor [Minisyncoccota bacterium]